MNDKATFNEIESALFTQHFRNNLKGVLRSLTNLIHVP